MTKKKAGLLVFWLFTSLASTSIAFRLSTTSISNSALVRWDYHLDHHHHDHHLCNIVSVIVILICVITVSAILTTYHKHLYLRTSILIVISDLPATTLILLLLLSSELFHQSALEATSKIRLGLPSLNLSRGEIVKLGWKSENQTCLEERYCQCLCSLACQSSAS